MYSDKKGTERLLFSPPSPFELHSTDRGSLQCEGPDNALKGNSSHTPSIYSRDASDNGHHSRHKSRKTWADAEEENIA